MTLESFKRRMHTIFGYRNDFLATRIYNLITDGV